MRPAMRPPEIVEQRMDDGYRVLGRLWRSDAPGPAAVGTLYLHGIQSHGGWYEWSASLLSERLGPVYMPDRRGSGRNAAARGDVPDGTTWGADLRAQIAWMREALGVRKLRLVGVSWGAKLAVAAAAEMPEIVERVLLIGPGIFPAVDVSPGAKWRIAMSLVRGGTGQIPIPLSEPSLFTDNPIAQAYIRDDRLKLERVTSRFLWYSRGLDKKLAAWPTGHLGTELVVLLAGMDRIIRNDRSRAWVRRVTNGAARVIELAGEHHTLEFSRSPEQFELELRKWASA